MPRTRVVLYRESDGTIPLLDWLDRVLERARDKCRVAIERLAELGHELCRPEADYLGRGIYELRVRLRTVNYRMLYFFHGNVAAVLAHGVVKEARIPAHALDQAAERKRRFEANPTRHTYETE